MTIDELRNERLAVVMALEFPPYSSKDFTWAKHEALKARNARRLDEITRIDAQIAKMRAEMMSEVLR